MVTRGQSETEKCLIKVLGAHYFFNPVIEMNLHHNKQYSKFHVINLTKYQ